MEKWKEIEGYEGYYEVSSEGNVRSLDREVPYSSGARRFVEGKIKKQTLNNDGYLTVKLSKNGVNKSTAVHRLVAKAFVDGYEEGLEVNHKDFERTNNNADNLEWVTHEENIRISYESGRCFVQTHDTRGENNPNYGNRKLSEIYSKNPDYAKEKCSRPGAKNGRAKAIRMIDENGNSFDFSYISECAQYLIDNGVTRSKDPYSVSAHISEATKNNKKYYNNTYKFI